MTLVALMTDELCATTGLNLMTPRCWSEDGRSARSTFLPLEAAQGLISNDLKQIGGQIKGTPTLVSLISIIRLLTAGRRPTPTSCFSFSHFHRHSSLNSYLTAITPLVKLMEHLSLPGILQFQLGEGIYRVSGAFV